MAQRVGGKSHQLGKKNKYKKTHGTPALRERQKMKETLGTLRHQHNFNVFTMAQGIQGLSFYFWRTTNPHVFAMGTIIMPMTSNHKLHWHTVVNMPLSPLRLSVHQCFFSSAFFSEVVRPNTEISDIYICLIQHIKVHVNINIYIYYIHISPECKYIKCTIYIYSLYIHIFSISLPFLPMTA